MYSFVINLMVFIVLIFNRKLYKKINQKHLETKLAINRKLLLKRQKLLTDKDISARSTDFKTFSLYI